MNRMIAHLTDALTLHAGDVHLVINNNDVVDFDQVLRTATANAPVVTVGAALGPLAEHFTPAPKNDGAAVVAHKPAQNPHKPTEPAGSHKE